MSDADNQPVSKAAKKPFDVSVLFAICGMLFSLLIFLFMLKQERVSAIHQFNVEMSHKLADFQYALTNNFQNLHNLQASLAVSPDGLADNQQALDRSVAENSTLKALVLLQNERAPVWSYDAKETAADSVSLQSWIANSKQVESGQYMVADIDQKSVLLFSFPSPARGNLVGFFDLKALVEQSLAGDLDPEIVLHILQPDGALVYAWGDQVVAEDSIINQSLSGELPWTYSYAVSEDYLSGKMGHMPALFLLMGLLLSFAIAAHLKKLNRNLAMLREEQEVLEQQVLDANWNDPLTGLANRVHFDETLDIECRRAVRDFSPLSMMVVEIDQYAEFVEKYGLQGAEVTLQKVAKELQSCVTRPGDLIARTDDHQFSLILPSTNEMVTYLADRCLQAIEELQLPHDSSSVSSVITISVGLVTLQPSKALTPERLLDGASEQLLQAQKGGGNQYVSFAEHGLEPGVTYSV